MEFLILAFEALKERKVRSFFTIFMVIVGVALIVGVEGVSNGARNFIAGEFGKFGTDMIIVQASGGTPISDSMTKEFEKLDHVIAVCPAISRPAIFRSRGQEKEGMIVGFEFDKLHYVVPDLRLAEGIYPPSGDKLGVVLGYQVAYNPDGSVFAEPGEAVKAKITLIQGNSVKNIEKSFIVKGIFDYLGSYVIPVDSMVWMSLKAAMKLFDADGYDTVYVVVDDDSVVNETAEYIQEKYNLRVITPQYLKESVDRILGAIDLYIGAISFVSLLVAAIGIITTLYTSMLERIREIGVLKAIGFKNRHILQLFLHEAVLIGVLGTIVGAIGGVALSHFLAIVFFSKIMLPIKPVFTPFVFVKASAMAIALSMLAGLYPAYRASRLDPVIALRHE